MSTGRQIPSRTTRHRGTTGALRDTPRHKQIILRYTPPHPGAHSGAPGDTPTGGGRGDPAAQRTWRPRLAPRRPQAPRVCVPARACPARARRHLWEERCALRPGRPGRRCKGEAVAMARPHANGAAAGAAPARPAPSARSFLPLSPAPRLGPRTPLREPTHPAGLGPGAVGRLGDAGGAAGPPEEAQAG